ncbi:unnamed protein product [Protopolystoma xenopodis]|uniref:Ig-like domain-containing protein n=1 Tax=Protopolystoma xenopodis TaxID=117903 RepID=A0A448XQK4_9PLAT|nr:unnamed protein product [Protopolystoma xenopodis]
MLRLECPIHDSLGDHLEGTRSETGIEGIPGLEIMYQWRVNQLPDHFVSIDPLFKFSPDHRVLSVVRPVEVADSGTYECSGVTGFGRRSAKFDVQITAVDWLYWNIHADAVSEAIFFDAGEKVLNFRLSYDGCSVYIPLFRD